jgi:uncharacterized protein YqeY
MSLKEQLAADLKDALRARDDVRRATLRLALAAIHNAEIAEGRELKDDETLAVVSKEARQRRESIEEFGKAGRRDMVEREQAELAVLSAYLPQALSHDEIVEAAREVVRETGASGPGDIGKVMPVVMERVRGRADGREVNQIVRELLAGGG